MVTAKDVKELAKDEKNLPKEKEKEKKAGGNKFVRAITALPRRMWNAITNSYAELRKVTWPSRKDLINYTAIVLVFMIIMACVVGVLDLGATELLSLIIG